MFQIDSDLQKITHISTIICALALLVLPVGASAKGPNSVHFAGPGIDRQVELVRNYAQRDLIVKLMEQSGLFYGTGYLSEHLPGKPNEVLGPRYTLTWAISDRAISDSTDVTILVAVQSLYPFADSGPVLVTHKTPTGWGGDVVGWYRAHPDMADTLRALGAPLPVRAGEISVSPGRAAEFGSLALATILMLASLVGLVGLRRRLS